MVSTFLHPGVYTQELQGPQQITGVSTSNTVFVGETEIGPYATPKLITSWNQYQATFGNFLWGRNVAYAVFNFFAQGGSLCYVVRAAPNPPASEVAASVTLGALVVSASSGGSWGNSLAVQLLNYPTESPPSATPRPIFTLQIYYKMPAPGATLTPIDLLVQHYVAANQSAAIVQGTSTYYLVEQYPGLSATDLAKSATDTTVPSAIETRINSQSLFVRVAVNGPGATRPPNVTRPQDFSNGEGDSEETPVDYATALSSLDPRDDIELLVLPDTPLIADLGKQRATIQEAISYCENRAQRDLFFIADPPFGLNVQDIEAFKSGVASGAVPAGVALNSSYGALYYPWIDFLNGLTSTVVPMPPSGAVAGTYAATDARVGVFKAPAGITDGLLTVAVGVERSITASDQDALNPNGINAIRNLARYGICTYGARTLSTDPSLTYVNVRRLLTYIENSLYWGMQWVVFEPNSAALWGAVDRDVTEFLTTLWQAGALFGAQASDAFSVTVDASNNPPATRNQGILYVDIKVAPVRPAEFVVIRIQQATLAAS